MDKHELEALKAAGFEPTTVAEFLGLTEVEEKIVEFRLQLSRAVRAAREARQMTQKELASSIGSSQSRVAKLEAGASDVSVDLMLKALFTAGGSMPTFEVVGIEMVATGVAAVRKAKPKKANAGRGTKTKAGAG